MASVSLRITSTDSGDDVEVREELRDGARRRKLELAARVAQDDFHDAAQGTGASRGNYRLDGCFRDDLELIAGHDARAVQDLLVGPA